MNKPKHTPGPWTQYKHVDALENVSTLMAIGRGDDSEDVAYINPYDVNGLANARLIAAAPELLGLLNAMNQQMHDAEVAGHFKHQLVANVEKLLSSLGGGYKTTGGAE